MAIVIRRAVGGVHFARAQRGLRRAVVRPPLHERRHLGQLRPLVLRAERLHRRLGLPQQEGLPAQLLLRGVVDQRRKRLRDEVAAHPQRRAHLGAAAVEEPARGVVRLRRAAAHLGVRAVDADEVGVGEDLDLFVEDPEAGVVQIGPAEARELGARRLERVADGERHVLRQRRAVDAQLGLQHGERLVHGHADDAQRPAEGAQPQVARERDAQDEPARRAARADRQVDPVGRGHRAGLDLLRELQQAADLPEDARRAVAARRDDHAVAAEGSAKEALQHRQRLGPVELGRERHRERAQHVQRVVEVGDVLVHPERRQLGQPLTGVHGRGHDLVAPTGAHDVDVGTAWVARLVLGLNDSQLVLERAHLVAAIHRRCEILALHKEGDWHA
mmetsp:Transcript_35997/g.115826  ORF Transcript_35997/g.115826 Transcript_35997/m.115826 type:complete len:388 (+) Transcript_35997:273-1436(+)